MWKAKNCGDKSLREIGYVVAISEGIIKGPELETIPAAQMSAIKSTGAIGWVTQLGVDQFEHGFKEAANAMLQQCEQLRRQASTNVLEDSVQVPVDVAHVTDVVNKFADDQSNAGHDCAINLVSNLLKVATTPESRHQIGRFLATLNGQR